MVCESPKGSFTATSSTPADSPRASSARVKDRPMRPKPLIPTRTVMTPPCRSRDPHLPAFGLQQSLQGFRQL